jgi:hypothetical protein
MIRVGMFFLLCVMFASPLDGQVPYEPSTSNPEGPELVAVFITSEFCQGSRQAHMPATIERMKIMLSEHAESDGANFAVVGVSLDWGTEAGIEHLSRFGRFDEIVVGRNWYGLGPTRPADFP